MEQSNKHQKILDELDAFFENATDKELNKLCDKVNQLTETKPESATVQTAVDWLIQQIQSDTFCDHINGVKCWDKDTLIEFLEEAKELERKQIKHLVDALNDIKNWDDQLEDEWGDPGFRAIEALKDYNKIYGKQ